MLDIDHEKVGCGLTALHIVHWQWSKGLIRPHSVANTGVCKGRGWGGVLKGIEYQLCEIFE